jgi:hypothetical protein
VPKHTLRAHAPFPPSSAERWLACPAAQRYAALLPPQEDTEHTTFGTCCHEISEEWLRANLDVTAAGLLAIDKASTWLARWEKTDESPTACGERMFAVAEVYVEYVKNRTLEAGEGAIRRLEERVTIAGKDCWGSLDCGLYVPFDFLEIIDLKGGSGKCVSPQDNEQLMAYAYGEAERYDWAFETVILTIVQPRRTDSNPPVWNHSLPVAELKAFGKRIKSAIKAAKALDAQPVAGKHCGWCVAGAICPAQRQKALSCLGTDPAVAPPDKVFTLPVPGALSPGELGNVLQHRKAIEAWFKACGALALTNPPPGWKVVESETKRKWIGEEEAHAQLVTNGLNADDFYSLSLLGITEATKLIKAHVATELSGHPKGEITARVAELSALLFVKPPGHPTLAASDDPRPSLDPLKCLPDLGEDE